MKYLFLILLLALSATLPAQVAHTYNTTELYDNTEWEDDIDFNGDAFVTLRSTTSAASTVTSQEVVSEGYGNIWVFLWMDNVSGTRNVAFQLGVMRGKGFQGADSDGYLWKHLYTATSDTSVVVSLTDSTWVSKFPPRLWKARIVETGAQQNDYQFEVTQFKDEG